jgi:hypothetical protein
VSLLCVSQCVPDSHVCPAVHRGGGTSNGLIVVMIDGEGSGVPIA